MGFGTVAHLEWLIAVETRVEFAAVGVECARVVHRERVTGLGLLGALLGLVLHADAQLGVLRKVLALAGFAKRFGCAGQHQEQRSAPHDRFRVDDASFAGDSNTRIRLSAAS